MNQRSARCVVHRRVTTYLSKQGQVYRSGVSRETTGAEGICMHLLRLPPGATEKAHLHRDHETAIYQISGTSEVRFGDRLEHHEFLRAGEFMYIPPNLPHQPRNASDDEEGVVLLARTDANEQESVELLPDIELSLDDWPRVPR